MSRSEGVMEVSGPLPGKKYFCLQSDKCECIFDTVCNRQKTRTVTRSLVTQILRFNPKTKVTKTVQNYPKNSRLDQGGGSLEYAGVALLNTPLWVTYSHG